MIRFKQFMLEKDMYKHLTAGELLKPGREGRGVTVVKKINDNEESFFSKVVAQLE